MAKKSKKVFFDQSKTIAPTKVESFNNQSPNENPNIPQQFMQPNGIESLEIPPAQPNPNPIKETNPNTKKLLTKLIILFVAIVVCAGLAFLITPKKEKTSPTPNEQETNTSEKQDESDSPDEEDEDEEEQEEIPFVFDETLSFDNGYVTNGNEKNQKAPFVPSRKTGVVECSSVTQETINSDLTLSIYFYYENNSLKKLIQKKQYVYKNSVEYNNYLATQEKNIENWRNTIGYKVFYINDDNKYTSLSGVLIDLKFGSTFKNNKNTKISIDYEYDENIAETLKKVYKTSDSANPITCSAIKTT